VIAGSNKASFRNMSVIEKYMMATGQDFKKIVNQVNYKRHTIEHSPSKKSVLIEEGEKLEN
jgi:hypothetical protein